MWPIEYAPNGRIDPQKLEEIQGYEKFGEVMKELIEGGWYLDSRAQARDQIRRLIWNRQIKAEELEKLLGKEIEALDLRRDGLADEHANAMEERELMEDLEFMIKCAEQDEDDRIYEKMYAHVSPPEIMDRKDFL
jgi:hypothetical protein